MSWEIFVNVNIQHIIPKNDSKKHTMNVGWMSQTMPKNATDNFPVCGCKCKPRREYTPANDGWIFVHDAYDGRLGVEWVNEILK